MNFVRENCKQDFTCEISNQAISNINQGLVVQMTTSNNPGLLLSLLFSIIK